MQSDQDKTTPTPSRRNDLLNLQIPEGGARIDLGEEWVFVIRPIGRQEWTIARQLISQGRQTEAAIALVDSLKLAGCPDAKSIPDTALDILLGLENAVAELVEPASAVIKKN